MSQGLSWYFDLGSPFVPELRQDILDVIVRDLRSDPSYFPGEAIAKHIAFLGNSLGLVSKETEISKKYGLDLRWPTDTKLHSSGYYRPIRLLFVSYCGLAEGLGLARQLQIEAINNCKHPETANDEEFVLANLEYGVRLLSVDPSGVDFLYDIIQKELNQKEEVFYGIGMETARRTFVLYLEKLTAMGYPDKLKY